MERNEATSSIRDRLAYHGGDLAAARQRFPDVKFPWLDLSTGINPRPYPVGPIAPEAWTRLPDSQARLGLEAIAARAYGAASPETVVAAPGTQAIIQWLPVLFPARRVGVLGFTYGEHARVWEAAGARVETVERPEDLRGFDVAVVVNPNNPDGRLLAPDVLCDIPRRNRLTVVDEAFMDVIDRRFSLVPDLPAGPMIVLRSFGKVFGLAGLRLGFAIASPAIAERLRKAFGPWAVAGPALAIGSAALSDAAWLAAAVARLQRDSDRMDAMLKQAGCTVVGGTPLFRFATSPQAEELFERLGRAGILARPFAHRIDWLRFGLCGEAADWERLEAALR